MSTACSGSTMVTESACVCVCVNATSLPPLHSPCDSSRRYGTGEDCGNGKKRSISYHMICANNFDTVDAPSFVYEAPTCEYHV